MTLLETIIINYKSCKLLNIEFQDSTPNIYIGLNDSGKSSVLQALGLLLNDKPKYSCAGDGNYKSDLSNSPAKDDEINALLATKGLPQVEYSEQQTTILGKLKLVDEEIEKMKEMSLSNTLLWAVENSANNELWIAKTFDSNSAQMMILTKDLNKGVQLWDMTAADLNKYNKEHEITAEDIQNENGKGRFSNMEKIRAGYSKGVVEAYWTNYKFAKSDKDIFPEFKYFDWNCSFEDMTQLANALMQEKIAAHLKPLKEQALEAARKAEDEVNKQFGEIKDIVKSVAKDVEEVKSKVHFDVKERVSDIMVKKLHSDGLIHLENQGEGLKRQIWFSLIKSKAETQPDSEINKFIWAFDEPETHLYPGAQREFFEILLKISLGNVQTLISTHSTVFIDKSNIKQISNVSQNGEGYSELAKCNDVESIHHGLGIKNSDFLFFNKFLIVEGDTEQYLIPELYKLYIGRTLYEDNIQLINIQGKDKWLINKALLDKVMAGFKKTGEQVIYLFDNDMSFEIGAAAVTDNMFFVGKQDIEDSISSEIWVQNLNQFYNELLTFSVDEVDSYIAHVEEGNNCPSNKKFYKILENKISAKWIEEGNDIDVIKHLPSKGSESSEFILSNLNEKDDIPEKIRNAFDKLQ